MGLNKMKTIYFDNGATTKVDDKVIKEMHRFHSEQYGNASSIHHMGEKALKALEKSRKAIASSIKAKPNEIIFTSGGTESNNFALKGIAFASKGGKNHIITTKIEHDCVLNTCKWLEKQGFKITYLDVDKQGFVTPEMLDKAITGNTLLVSIIHGNNEIGTIQDLPALYRICKKHGAIFHTDACQSYTKTPLTSEMADMITLNAHKIHGPKGVGALYIKTGIKLVPLIHGGSHEKGLRAGTENIPAIAGFAAAVELAMHKKHVDYMENLRDYFIKEALKIPGTKLNGPTGKKRLCNNINISFRSIEGESITFSLDQAGICCSTGSACSSKSLEPSHVIMALVDDPERSHGSVRITISRFTKKQEVDFALKELKKAVKKLREISPLTPRGGKHVQ